MIGIIIGLGIVFFAFGYFIYAIKKLLNLTKTQMENESMKAENLQMEREQLLLRELDL